MAVGQRKTQRLVAESLGLRRHHKQTEAPEQDRLLRVQPVLRLVPNQRLRAIEHRIGRLFAAMCGQAMEEFGIGLRTRHQAFIDLIGHHRRNLVVRVVLPHRHPGIGNDNVGTRNCLCGIARQGNIRARSLG